MARTTTEELKENRLAAMTADDDRRALRLGRSSQLDRDENVKSDGTIT
jgi:hypothetical protein